MTIYPYDYFSLYFRAFCSYTNTFFFSWSSLHRHCVAMANSCAQSHVMLLITVTRTGKFNHVSWSICPCVYKVHAIQMYWRTHTLWFICYLFENICIALNSLTCFCLQNYSIFYFKKLHKFCGSFLNLISYSWIMCISKYILCIICVRQFKKERKSSSTEV